MDRRDFLIMAGAAAASSALVPSPAARLSARRLTRRTRPTRNSSTISSPPIASWQTRASWMRMRSRQRSPQPRESIPDARDRLRRNW